MWFFPRWKTSISSMNANIRYSVNASFSRPTSLLDYMLNGSPGSRQSRDFPERMIRTSYSPNGAVFPNAF
jgi:hypothetical protein